MTAWKTQHGDPTATDHVILRTTVGSQVHGMAISGTDDHDEMGVYVQRSQDVLGVSDPAPHLILRTAQEGQRSYHGDVDLNLYALRHYLSLAVKGNPSMLLPLFVPEEFVHEATELGRELRELAPSFASLNAGRRFLGYLDSQRERLTGEGKRNRVPKRPELVERHGYDVKYASHALRLAHQGVQLLTERKLILPMTGSALYEALGVKRGDYSYEAALQMIDETRAELVDLLADNPYSVPETADLKRITSWSVSAHLRHWESRS